MADEQRILDTLLNASTSTPVTFDDGGETMLRPARVRPVPDGDERTLWLDGTWQAARWPFDADEKSLAAVGVEDGRWESLHQPGKVFYQDPEKQPWGEHENWNRVTLAHIDPEDGAMLRRRVTVSPAWAGTRVVLRFGAIYPAGRVYCNGELLGEQTSGLTPVEFDVTDLVHPGEEAVVAVRLLRRHPLVSLDMPRHAMEFAGLAQSAQLVAVEPVYCRELYLRGELDETFTAGSVTAEMTLAGAEQTGAEASVSLTLTDPGGSEIGCVEASATVSPGEESRLDLTVEVPDAVTWSAEKPGLYEARMELTVAGQDPQRITRRVGLRRLSVDAGRPTLNGRPVKFRGVNFLTFHPYRGLHTPREWLAANLSLMKKANVNCIRTHFLSDPALVELCDEMGFYLMQEIPFDWATNQLDVREAMGDVLHRVEAGVRRDRGHPSMVVWSLGNENLPGGGERAPTFWSNARLIVSLAETLGPGALTMWPPPGPANKVKGLLETRLTDIADTHYTFRFVRQLLDTGRMSEAQHWEGLHEDRTREECLARGWSGVWFSSEWGLMNYMPDLLTSPYLSLLDDEGSEVLTGRDSMQVFRERFEREWGLMRDDEACLGGAFFPWMCAGAGDPWGWTLWGEDADWGVVTHDLTTKPSFWVLRVCYAPVLFPDRVVWRDGDEEVALPVRNLYSDTDLSECTLRTMMGRGGRFMGNMRRWRDVETRCAPGESTTVMVPLWNPQTLEDLAAGMPAVCRLILLDPDGFRPITHDVLLVPESVADGQTDVPIGPDANIANL